MKNIKDRLTRIDAVNLPTPPAAVIRLSQMLAREGVTGEEIAAAISLDTTLAARVLRLANSIALGGSGSVESIDEAVLRVGVDSVRDVVFSLSMVCAMKPAHFNYRPFWRHSIAVANTARILQARSQVAGAPFPEAYAAGLLHDIGMLALDRVFGLPYRRVLDDARKSGRALFEVEQEALSTTHAELGARVLETWQFPARLIDAARAHHNPWGSGSVVTLLVYLADFVCNSEGLDHGTGHRPVDCPDRAWAELGLRKDDLPEIVACLRKELVRAEAIVSVA